MTRTASFIACAALMITSACGDGAPGQNAGETITDAANSAPDTAQGPVTLPDIGPKASTLRTADIDWSSARTDRASQNDGSDDLVSIASTSEPAAVPVLLPTGIVAPASAERGIMFRQTSDGYFASYPGEVYDVVINGTNLIAGTSADTGARVDEPVFTSSVAGAQLSLSRYGADYLIEFECNVDLGDEADTCITEEEALETAEKLIVVGTR